MKIIFFLILTFLSIDSWPLGGALLREFGVRPTNFFLLMALLLILAKKIKSKNMSLRFEPASFGHMIYFFIAILGLNIIIIASKFLLDFIDATQFIKGLLQFLMVIWFFVSIIIWKLLFQILRVNAAGYQYFVKCIIFSAFINLVFFCLDYFNVNIAEISGIDNFLILIRGVRDIRTSGLSSEPSIYASWVLLVWPLLVFPKKKLISSFMGNLSIIIGVACVVSGLICGARTFLLIFLLQATIILLLFSQAEGRSKAIAAGCAIALLISLGWALLAGGLEFYLGQLRSIIDIETNYSSVTRLGSALAAFNMFYDNLIAGIGIGQFTYAYSHYVPDWALISPEVQAYVSGDIEHRINAFNLFLRIGAEMGLCAFLIFSYFIFRILSNIYHLMKGAKDDRLWWIGVVVSSVGGLSYFLQQDLFSYQPAIFSIGLILYLSKINSNGR